MNDINVVVVEGRLCRDPIVRVFQSGSVVGNFTLASNTNYKDRTGQITEETAFAACVVWGKPAEWLREHKKGELVLVSGRLRTEAWEADGEQHSRLVVVCDGLQFLQRRRHEPTAPAEAGEPPAPAVATVRNGAPPF